VIGDAANALKRGATTFESLAAGLPELTAASPALDRFLRVLVPAAPAISKGFFVNFPDEAAEPGTQPFDPTADPRRHYWRGAAVLTCQSFGVPIRPGCLQDFLSGGGAGSSKPSPQGAGRASAPAGRTPHGPSASSGGGGAGSGDAGPSLPRPLRHLHLGGSGSGGGPDAGAPIRDLLNLVLGP
jgi:hypothetical protein